MVYIRLIIERITDKVFSHQPMQTERSLFAVDIKGDKAITSGVYPRFQVLASGLSVNRCNPANIAKVGYLIPTLEAFDILPDFICHG